MTNTILGNILINMILENLYYTEYYKNHWLKYGILFENKHLKKESKTILNDNYYMIHKKYSGYIHKKDIIGYDRSLYSSNDNSLIFSYKSDDSKIFKIIEDNSNNEYFIFNRDLSGFSIISLNNKNEEFNFYNNKEVYNDIDNSLNGNLVFIDLEYLNNKILFFIFYLLKTENDLKRIFTYLLFDFSKDLFDNKINTIKLLDIKDIILRKYNYNLCINYKANFKENNIIIVEDIINKKIFEITNNDY